MTKVPFALTIARCRIDEVPTKQSIYDIRDRLFHDHQMNMTSFKVECFELKKNGWLHYHASILCKGYPVFKDIRYSGWSVKLKLLRTYYDINNWCGYVCKHKIDVIDIKITYKKVQSFKKDAKVLKKIPHIMTFLDVLSCSEGSDFSD